MAKVVKLETKEKEIITADAELMSKSVLIKGMIDDGGIDEIIPLPEVSNSILNKIIEFLTHLKDNQPPEI